ncbi:MAG: SCO family protein [Methylophilus sp.]|nr:SCO family protein [Methylophilus sp.]
MRKWLFLLLLTMLTACSAGQKTASFIGTDITGAQFGAPLTLTDHTGKLRAMSDFKGKVVVMFFGYTHCPDVCPTTMSDLKQTMKLLGSDADQVQVLFVTVDPDRDTKEVLAQFVPAFDKRFLGLTGTLEEVAKNMGSYKIFSRKVPSASSGSYSIDHSAGLYVFDKTGTARIYMGYGQKPADIAHDLAQLL